MQREAEPREQVPATREALWERLERTLVRARAGLSLLSDREVEDLGRLYRAAATHLALMRAFGASTRQTTRQNDLVARAHDVIYGRPRRGRNAAALLAAFLGFPVTVRRTRRYHLLSALLLLVGVAYGYLGAARDPEWALAFVAPGDVRTPYASTKELRESLLAGRPGRKGDGPGHHAIGSGKKAAFAAFLWQNNTRVALMAFFSGFLAGVPTALLLLMNGAMLGVYTHTFQAHGLGFAWWAWILPHGVTELLAIVLLGGGGLLLGHTVLAPGDRGRRAALRAVRGDALRLVLFAFPMLLLAALFESFLRQSGLSDPARYVVAAACAVGWALFLGFARPPGSAVRRLVGEQTLAERAVPLPVEEDILGLTVRRRG